MTCKRTYPEITLGNACEDDDFRQTIASSGRLSLAHCYWIAILPDVNPGKDGKF